MYASPPSMFATPAVSVVLSVHNDAPFLAEAIESILAQSVRDFEFLIVDDGATDGSGAIIDRYAAADPRIRAFHQPNRGLIFSLNRMIAEARAPLIARMDGDDVALPERFAAQMRFLSAHTDHGVLGTGVIGIDVHGAVRRDWSVAYPTDDAAFRAALPGGALICHPSVMMRRDLVLAVGGYRAAYRHSEDYDLWLRLSERTRITSLPDRLLHYRGSPDQVSRRHGLEQRYGAAVALAAHRHRADGRPDPTQGLERLPPLGDLDALFGTPGTARGVRAALIEGSLYDGDGLAGPAHRALLDYLRETPRHRRTPGLWRAAGRMVRSGHPLAAGRLALALARR